MFEQVHRPLPDKMHIGLSLTYCIRDIIEDKITVDQVVCIITGTKLHSDEEWDRVLRGSAEAHWKKNPVAGMMIARYFKDKDLLIQPRLLGEHRYICADEGHWLVLEGQC